MSNTPYVPWMKSLLNQMKELYGKTNAKTIAEALPDGSFFEIKGSVSSVSSLPNTGNRVGDIYIVTSDGAEYIWITSETYPDGYWEKLGSDSGPGLYPVVFSYNNGWSTSHTYLETYTAYQSGKTILFLKDELACIAVPGEDGGEAYFKGVATDGDAKIYSMYLLTGMTPPAADVSVTEVEEATKTTTVSGATPTITPKSRTDYHCGTLTSLTISNPPATGKYRIVFTSGSTPTATIIPPVPAMRWQTDDNEPPQGFPAANTRYEINVDDTYVVLGEWPVPGVST